jgi:hypothetical protein
LSFLGALAEAIGIGVSANRVILKFATACEQEMLA